MDYIKEIELLVADAAGVDISETEGAVSVPKDEMGDYAFPCFKLSKTLRKSPAELASELASRIKSDAFENVVPTGPYINFFVDKARYAVEVIGEILNKGRDYGSGGGGQTVVIDYSSPNITHEFHVGHLLSTTIGAALYRIYKFLGYNTVGINYIGDWGAQFGRLVCGYKLWSGTEALDRDGVDELTRVYVKFHAEAEKDPELNKRAREWLNKMDAGDPEAVALWQRFRQLYLDEINKIYDRLNVTFDSWLGESYYNDKMAGVVEEIAAKGLLKESDGAMIVDLEPYKMPPCLILRSDGGTLYPSRDIAAALDRKNRYDFQKSLYVVDMRQSLHFAQFFKVIELMGHEWAKDMVHLPFGLLTLETGELSARKGNVILLKDLFDEAARRALAIINEKNAGLEDKERAAEDVGVGAVVFGVLYNSRTKDTMFSWDKALSFDGETGPYVQYAHARACGVLEKAGEPDAESPDLSLLADKDAAALVKTLGQFPGKVREAADKYEPFIVSRALVQIAQAFNKFYHDNPILTSGQDIKRARLALVKAVRDVLAAGLALIGVKAPERM